MKALEIQIDGNHYKSDYEVYEYISDHDLNYTQGNILKYVTRFAKKNGERDLTKALHHCEMGMESKESNKSNFVIESARRFCKANDTHFNAMFLFNLHTCNYRLCALAIDALRSELYGEEEQQ